jgi:general secretion pathway protein K
MSEADDPARRWQAAPHDRGFALLVALWSLALLALIGTHITASGRAETRIAANLRAAAVAEAAADGALFQAVFHLLDGSARRWLPDGQIRELPLSAGGIAVVRVESEEGKINPNTASADLLQALLLRVGADPRRAAAVAAAMMDWRTASQRPRPLGAKEPQYRAAGRDYAPPGNAFESLDEVGLVLGMTPDLLALLAPHLSIYPDGEPDLLVANPIVARALEDVDATGGLALAYQPSAAPVVSITATSILPGGATFTRQAHVRLGTGTRGRSWQILTWNSPGT